MRTARDTVRAPARLASIAAAALLAAHPAAAFAAALTLSNPGAVTGGSVVAETSANTPALRLGLQASAGTITVSAIGVSIGAGVAGVSVKALQLWADNDNSGTVSAGDALLATGGWSPARGRYVFGGFSLPVATTVKQVLVTVGVGVPYVNGSTYGPASSSTFAVSAASADVGVDPGNTVNAGTVTGTSFTIAAGTLAEGSSTSGSTAPVIAILNPGDGAAVSPTCATCTPANGFRVQVQVFSPGGAPLSNVQLSTDNGSTWLATPALAVNGNYASVVGANAYVYEANLTACASGCNLAPGLYTLRARATNSGGANIASPAVVIAVNAPGSGDGNLLVRDNSSQLCVDCHAIQSHSSQTTDNKYGSWSTTCRDCHTPHRTTNVKLVKNVIAPPAANGFQPARAANFGSRTGDSAVNVSSANFGSSSFTNADNSGPCQVCHTRTQSGGGAARWRNTGNADTHYTAAAGTQACTGCHDHSKGFAGGGESMGGSACGGCHANLFTPMGSTSGYHHYLNNANTGYPAVASIGGTADANRKCLMCHVDHDVFRPDVNTANGGRGKNLRTDVNLLPSATANFTNTDFDNALARGGICLSCHTAQQTKSYAQTDGSTATPALTQAAFNASTHNYAVPATFAGTLTNTFSANCSKCHTDNTTKSKQTSAYPNQFGLHDSALRRMTHPLGDTVVTGTATGAGQSTTALVDTSKTWTAGQFDGYAVTMYDATNGRRTAVVKSTAAPSTLDFLVPVAAAPVAGTTTYTIGDPSEEHLCLQCHAGGAAGNDAYGARAMTQAAKRFDQFGKLYAAGTMSASAGSTAVTGTGTTWVKTSGASGVTFTNGSNAVVGTGTTWDSSMVGWSIRNTGVSPPSWYSIVKVTDATHLTISPSYGEATAASAAWRIAIGDWYLRCDADSNGLWYRVSDVTSATALTASPGFVAACSGTYVVRSAPGHPLATTAGQHRVDEPSAQGWNGGAGRHVTCADCHDPHEAQAGTHTPGGTGTLGGANVGTWGVAVSYPLDKTGTATFTNASGTVTWTGGSFAANDVGKNITGPDSVVYQITAVASATSATISPAYKGTTTTSAFTIKNPAARTGRATFTHNGATVTWVSGAAWSAADAGKVIVGPDGFNYSITAATATTLTISPAFRGESSDTVANNGGSPFTIKEPVKVVASGGGFTSGSGTVTWTGGSFASSDVDRYINAPDRKAYRISAFTSATQVTITPVYAGTTASNAAFTVSSVGYTVASSLGTADLQAAICLKCHSSYGYGASQPTTTISTGSTTYTSNGSANLGMPGGQTDIAEDFNPGQLAHHAVLGPGRNQPPDNANANWASSAGRKNATWAGGANPAAGLDNTFVDGWGKGSRVTCSDCHSSNSSEDPWGPHGSANQWILKGIDTSVTVTLAGGTVTYPNGCYYKGSTSTYSGVPNTGDRKNFCLNCHRADVYGLVTSGGSSTGTSCNAAGTAQVSPITYRNLSRINHPADNNPESNSVSDGALTRWGIACMQCHGGESLGAIHGTNALKGPNGTSFRGKRFLAGATWFGHTRPTTTTAVTCWTKNNVDTVNTCSQGHGGSSGNRANYDYDSGGD